MDTPKSSKQKPVAQEANIKTVLPTMAASNMTYTKPLVGGSDPKKAFGGRSK
jgi:hypothetical protein